MNFVIGRTRVLPLALVLMLAGSVGSLAAVLDASPASASCALPGTVEKSIHNVELVFVGTVVKLTNQDRWATFAIDELWKGTPHSKQVEVHGGPKPVLGDAALCCRARAVPAAAASAASDRDRGRGRCGRLRGWRDPGDRLRAGYLRSTRRCRTLA